MEWPNSHVLDKIEALNDIQVDEWMGRILKLGCNLDRRQGLEDPCEDNS